MPSSSVQFSCSVVSDSVTPWTAALQASLSITQSLLKLMSIESVMPSNHLILCHPLLLPPSSFSSIRVFSMPSVEGKSWSSTPCLGAHDQHSPSLWAPLCSGVLSVGLWAQKLGPPGRWSNWEAHTRLYIDPQAPGPGAPRRLQAPSHAASQEGPWKTGLYPGAYVSPARVLATFASALLVFGSDNLTRLHACLLPVQPVSRTPRLPLWTYRSLRPSAWLLS